MQKHVCGWGVTITNMYLFPFGSKTNLALNVNVCFELQLTIEETNGNRPVWPTTA